MKNQPTKHFLKFRFKKSLEIFSTKMFSSKEAALDYYWDSLRGKISTFTLCSK